MRWTASHVTSACLPLSRHVSHSHIDMLCVPDDLTGRAAVTGVLH